MTGSLAGGFAANRGPDSIPVTVSSFHSEPMTGIEPALPAWEAGALPLSYIGVFRTKCGRPHHIGWHLRKMLGVLLSDHDILAELDSGRITVDPFTDGMIQPSSIDVRLDKYFRVFDNHKYPHIDPAMDQSDLTRPIETDGDDIFILHPGEFVLGSTYETVALPNDIAARLEGKSSLGRLGLMTHSTAGFIDPGFSGHVTLELA